jgi:hypothetical protein
MLTDIFGRRTREVEGNEWFVVRLELKFAKWSTFAGQESIWKRRMLMVSIHWDLSDGKLCLLVYLRCQWHWMGWGQEIGVEWLGGGVVWVCQNIVA